MEDFFKGDKSTPGMTLGRIDEDTANTYWFDENGRFVWGGMKTYPGFNEYCIYCGDRDKCAVAESVGCTVEGDWEQHEERVFGPK